MTHTPSTYSYSCNTLNIQNSYDDEGKKTRIQLQGDQDHFFPKEMPISLSILKLHKNP